MPITEPKTANFNIDYNGTTYGGGTTLAGGYRSFFGGLGNRDQIIVGGFFRF